MVDTIKKTFMVSSLKALIEDGQTFSLKEAHSKNTGLTIGRLDKNKNNVVDIDLEDKEVSREMATVKYYNKDNHEFLALENVSATCTLAYVVEENFKYQLLEGFLVDLGGAEKCLLTFLEISPKKQIEFEDTYVLSPLYTQEKLTQGLGTMDEISTLSIHPYKKGKEEPLISKLTSERSKQ